MAPRMQEHYRLASPGGELLVSLSQEPSASASWAVVYLHGFGSTHSGEKATALEAACASRGWTYASFDFRGHGASAGTLLDLRPSGLLEDLAAVREDLARRGLTRLCLVGSSMGGWAALWFTHRQPQAIVACTLLAPAVAFLRLQRTRLSPAELEAWKRTGRRQVRNQWLDVEIGAGLLDEEPLFPPHEPARTWNKPLLIFHGMQDDSVPYQDTLAFVEAVPGGNVELRLLRSGDHRLLAFRAEMAETACDLFSRSVERATGVSQRTNRD